MKGLISIIAMLSLLCCTLAFGRDDSLLKRMNPKLYKKRNKPVMNIALVYYGSYYTETDLERVQKLLEKRFFLATASMIKLNTVFKAILPFKHQITSYPDYRQEYVTDIERLQRLWYYDNVNAKILNEVHDQVRKSSVLKKDVKKIDALVIVTGAQFDALGFADGRVAVTENPMEIAWGLSDGGRVEFVTDERVVDELVHELGHVMFLDHTSNQCFKPGMSYNDSNICCSQSPAKNDVMSYCRKRALVNEEHFYGFEACNLKMIKEKIVPSMMRGGKWKIKNREKCQ